MNESDNISTRPARKPARKPLPSVNDIQNIDIEGGVKNVEGGGANGNGSSVHPTYKPRKIIYYPVTEDELDQIANMNRVSTFFFAAGSFFGGFALDVFKEASKADDVVKSVVSQASSINVSAIMLCLACYGIAVTFMIIKRNQANNIKTASFDNN